MERRKFIKKSLLTASVIGLGGKYAFADNPTPRGGHPSQFPIPENAHERWEVPHFEAMKTPALVPYERDSRNTAIWIHWKNEILTCYRAETRQKYPYFYPLEGLGSGLSLTTEAGNPFPHHRSVFFGLDRIETADGERHGFWQNHPDRDRIVSTRLELGEMTERSIEFFNDCLWTPHQREPIIADKRRFVLTVIDDTSYTLDCYFELTALTDLRFNRTNHGLFGVRLANDLSVNGGGVLINSEGGQRRQGTDNRPARWMAAYGKRFRRNDGLIEGLAIMAPPYTRAPFDKGVWFVRNFGNFSPMPFNALDRYETVSFPKNDVIKLAYRLVTYTGVPTTSFLNAQWEEFTALSEGKRS